MGAVKETRKWYAVYTKPRWEKKVHALFEERSVISYCPLNKIRKRWSDRYKIVNEPLFKSYVFVNIREDEMPGVRMVPGVVNFVYWNGKPAVIKEKEITTIKRFLNEYEFVEVENVKFELNQKVKILNGVLMDREGIITRTEKNKVELVLESLGFRVTAQLAKTDIRPSAKSNK